jgi:hypothetical protein
LDSIEKNGDIYTKKTAYSGIRLETAYSENEIYKLSYVLTLKGGTLKNIGGHNASFLTKFKVYSYSGNEKKNLIGET